MWTSSKLETPRLRSLVKSDDGRTRPKLVEFMQRILNHIIICTRKCCEIFEFLTFKVEKRFAQIRRLPRKQFSHTTLWSTGWTESELIEAQKNDPAISKLLEWKQCKEMPSPTEVSQQSPEIRHYWLYWNSLEVHDNLLFKRSYHLDGDSSNLQLLVPAVYRKEVFKYMHENLLSGHLGRIKTIEKLRQLFYWFKTTCTRRYTTKDRTM